MSHIARMVVELKDLNTKITFGESFYQKELEDPKFTDEVQRGYLALQLEAMKMYAETLEKRIDYDRKKMQREEK